MKRMFWIRLVVGLLLATTLLSGMTLIASGDGDIYIEYNSTSSSLSQRVTYIDNRQIINVGLAQENKKTAAKSFKESKDVMALAGSVLTAAVTIAQNPEINEQTISAALDVAIMVSNFVPPPYGTVLNVGLSLVKGFLGSSEPSEMELLQQHLDEQFEIVNKGIEDIRNDISELSQSMSAGFEETVDILKNAIEAQTAGNHVYAFVYSGAGNFDYSLFKNYLYGIADASNGLAQYAYADKLTSVLLGESTEEQIEMAYNALYSALNNSKNTESPYIEGLRAYIAPENNIVGVYSIQRYYYDWMAANRDLLEAEGKSPEWEAVNFMLDLYQTMLCADGQLMACNNYFLRKLYEKYGTTALSDFSYYQYVAPNGDVTYITYKDLINSNAWLAGDENDHRMTTQLLKDLIYILNMENSYMLGTEDGSLSVVNNYENVGLIGGGQLKNSVFGQLYAGQTVYMNKLSDEICEAFAIDPQKIIYEWTVDGSKTPVVNDGSYTVNKKCEALSVAVKYEGETLFAQEFTIISSNDAFSGGSGTESDPYLISKPEQFWLIKTGENSRAYYKLICDIDFLSSGIISTRKTLTTIGDENNVFEGVFDGNGYSIKNVKIGGKENCAYAGLFAVIGEGGAVKNLTIEDFSLSFGHPYSNDQYAGAFAGKNEGRIYNCHILNGEVGLYRGSESDRSLEKNCLNTYVGGIAGISCGSISKCSVMSSAVKGSSSRKFDEGKNKENKNSVYVGGIAGQITEGAMVESCVVEGESTIKAYAYSYDADSGLFQDDDPYITVCAAGIVGNLGNDCGENNIQKIYVATDVDIKDEAKWHSSNDDEKVSDPKLSPRVAENYSKSMASRGSIQFPAARQDSMLSYRYEYNNIGGNEKFQGQEAPLYRYSEDFLKISDVYYVYACTGHTDGDDQCTWVYNEALGYAEGGIAAWTKCERLPATFKCPVCGGGKDALSQKTDTAGTVTLKLNDESEYTLKSYTVIGYYGFDTLNTDKINSKSGMATLLLSAVLEDAKKNITYELLSVEVPYVVEPLQAIEFAIESMPKTEYQPGEELSIHEGVFKLIWADGSEEEISSNAIAVDGNTSVLGESKVTLSYEGFEVSYAICVECIHVYDQTKTIAPTCISGGYTVQICSVCQDRRLVEGSEKAALGHTMPELKEREGYRAPTCREEGYVGKAYCQAEGCNAVLEMERKIDMIPHEYKEVDYTYCKCELCNHDDTTAPHTYSSVENATSIIYSCDKCGKSFTVEKSQATEDVPRVVVGNSYGVVGKSDEIVVYVKLFKNPGITGVSFRIEYDPRLEYVRYERGELLSKINVFEVAQAPGAIGFEAGSAYEQGGNGNLLKLVFKLPAGAKPLEKYDISIAYTGKQFTNNKAEGIDIITMPGSITAVSHLPGDVNNDDALDITDAVLLARYHAIKLTQDSDKMEEFLANLNCMFNEKYADVNLDLVVDLSDLVLILQCLVGKNEIELSPNEFWVVLNTNNGVLDQEEILVQIYDENGNRATYGELPTPEREGYRFDGWYHSFVEGERVDPDDVVKYNTQLKKQTLYARWTEIFYVEYDSDKPGNATAEVEGTMERSEYAYNEENLLRDNAFTLKGWTFKWWRDENGKTYRNKEDIGKLLSAGQTIKLYAVWEPYTYKIVFNNNRPQTTEGLITEQMESFENLKYDHCYNLPENTYNLVGWTFKGWKTKNGDTIYDNEGEIKNLIDENKELIDGGSITLYAVWKANEYEIVFNKNKPSNATYEVKGEMENQKCTYDVEFTLNTLAYELYGWVFKGWATSPNTTEIKYGEHANIKNLCSFEGATYTLYAVWEPQTYVIQFHTNRPSNASDIVTNQMPTQTCLFDTDISLPSNTYQLTGWIFDGWATEENGAVVYSNMYSGKNLASEGVCNLYAVWHPITYTVKFDGNGGLGEMDDMIRHYDDKLMLSTNSFERDGFEFVGWKDGNGKGYDPKTTGNLCANDGNEITLYAQWSYNQYSIFYDSNGGDGRVPSSEATFGKDVTIAENSFTKEGYTFVGWNTAGDGNGRSFQPQDKVVGGILQKDSGIVSITLYAQWAPNTYTVNFDTNGGKVEVTSCKVTYGKIYGDLTNLTKPTRTGYEFNGWYYNGEKILDTTIISVAKDHTLKADWTPLDYTITFDSNGGEVTEALRNIAYDSRYGELPTPTRKGYTFDGWYTKDGSKVGADYITKGDAVLYAHWKYEVVYDANGGTGTMSSVTHSSDAANTLSTNQFVREGYEFVDWNTQSDGKGYSYDPTFAGDLVKVGAGEIRITLYAQWRPVIYTVTFDANGGNVAEMSRNVAYDSHYGELPTPTRKGYIFDAWYTKDGAKVGADYITKGDATLYAHWKYEVAYDANGGTGTMSSVTHNSDAANTLSANQFVKVGYEFVGWNTQSD